MFTEKIPEMVNSVIDFFKKLPLMALQWGKDLLDNFTQGIKDKIGNLKETLRGAADKVKDFLGFSEPDEGPLSNFHTFAPDMMELFASGIKDNTSLITDAISGSFNLQPQIRNAVGMVETTQGAGMNGTFVFPLYIGGDKVDEYVLNAQDVYNYRSGGR